MLGTIIHLTNIAVIILLSSFGSSIGGSKASAATLESINIQPRARKEIMKAFFIGIALIETASILSLISCFFLIGRIVQPLSCSIGEIGIALGMGISAYFIGISSALPVQATCFSIARQPFFGQKVINLMLILQSIIQTGIIFAFIIGLSIQFQLRGDIPFYYAFSLAAGGLAIGFGSIGPVLGLSNFAQKACTVISRNRKTYGKLVSFVFMAGAIIETPLIFSLIVSLSIIIFSSTSDSLLHAISMMSASLCIALATYMTGRGSSRTAQAACQQIAMNESAYETITHASLLAQGLIDTSAIYALLICIAIIMFF